MSPPQPESQSEQKLENPKTLKTYSDFKKTLSESERENFLEFVRKKAENLERPINDLEAWLASKNSAKRNRWEVYYEIYQQEKIKEREKTTRQGDKPGNYSPSEVEKAIAEFKNRHKKREQELKQIKAQEQLKNAENNPDNQKNE